jgi:hypothetical protein
MNNEQSIIKFDVVKANSLVNSKGLDLEQIYNHLKISNNK